MNSHQTITDCVHEIDRKIVYSQCKFHCETLKLSAEALFTGCHFPNLRLIEVDFDSNESWVPFDDTCSFDHPVNLHFEQACSVVIPKNMVLASVLSEQQSSIRQSLVEVFKTTGPEYKVFNPLDLKVSTRVGDSSNEYLSCYKEHFAAPTARFSHCVPEILIDDIAVDVMVGGHVLGKLNIEVTPDPFAVAVVKTGEDTKMLHYTGNVSANWSAGIHDLVKRKLQEMCEVHIDGSIEREALSGMKWNLRRLKVTGYLGASALAKSIGRIDHLEVDEITSQSLDSSEVYIRRVDVKHLSSDAEICAHIVSISNSWDASGITSVKHLIVRDTFEGPLDLKHVSPTRVDFRTVTSPGPFTVENWAGNGSKVYNKPSLIVNPKVGSLTVHPWDQVYSKVWEELEYSHLSDVSEIYRIEIRLDDAPIQWEESFILSGEYTAWLDGQCIGKWFVHVREEVYWGLVGLFLGAAVALAF